MPNAVPAVAAAQLPPARMIDPRGHRFGAATSSLILIASFVAGWVPGVLLVLLSIGVSAAFGLKYSIYGVIWRRIVKIAHLGKSEPEHEYPPRFAQTLGSIVLIASLLAFAVGASTIGWILALLSIGTSAAFGLKYSIYGAIWRRIVRIARLGKTEPEHEYPPRFAQTLGSAALILSLLAFVGGWSTLGWALALAVAALQGVLAVTGYCLGCRLYFLRWWVPSVATSLWTRSRGTKAEEAFGSPFSSR